MDEDPGAPNYDPKLKLIKSLMNGSRGPMVAKHLGQGDSASPARMRGRRVHILFFSVPISNSLEDVSAGSQPLFFVVVVGDLEVSRSLSESPNDSYGKTTFSPLRFVPLPSRAFPTADA